MARDIMTYKDYTEYIKRYERLLKASSDIKMIEYYSELRTALMIDREALLNGRND